MTVLIAADLDRTLIYSKAALGPADDRPALRCVELIKEKRSSFMTESAAIALTEVAESAVFIPVTTRTAEQLGRVRLPARTKYAIAANGGLLLVDQVVDLAWSNKVARRAAEVASLAEVWQHVNLVCANDWTRKLRQAAGLFCYAVTERDRVPADFVAETTAWAAERGWTVSFQGRKLYWVPSTLTKSAAMREVARRVDADVLLAAGDSLLDRDLLEAADHGIQPRHGELFESGWSAPHVVQTEATGVLAGEEISRWFADQLAARRAA